MKYSALGKMRRGKVYRGVYSLQSTDKYAFQQCNMLKYTYFKIMRKPLYFKLFI